MSHPNDINMNTYEKISSMKNMFGNGIVEILKPNIKTHQNESVIKMLDLAKDQPNTYIELLSVAIFHRNFEIIKYMVEKFHITENDSPFMNALSFYNSIFPDNSEHKINEAKDNYDVVKCPFVIMSGIGGDVDIFKYLLKNKLISDISEVGVVGLTKKLKNIFFSNIIGACCYYGRKELLEHILKNNDIDKNIQTKEKKSKIGQRVAFSRDYSGLTPAMLSVIGPISDEDTVKILKILNSHNCKFIGSDNNKDNILHLATRNKKIETAKYLIDELNMKNLMEEKDKGGYTPKALAQHLNNEDFINYFSIKEGIDDEEAKKTANELLIESNADNNKNKKKNKKKKNKNDEDEIHILNSSEYQETIKEYKTTAKKKKPKTYYEKNEEEEEYIQEEPKTKKIKNKKQNENNNYNASQNSEKLRALLEKPQHKKKKEKKENNDNNIINNNDIEIHVKKIEVKEDLKEIKEEPKEKEIKKPNILKPQEEDEEIIIGLGSKNKKNKKLKKNTKEEKEKEKEKEKEEEKLRLQLEEERRQEEEKRKLEEEEEIRRKEREMEELRKQEELRKIEEEKERERIQKLKEEEELKRKQEEELKRRQEEELRRKQKEEELRRKQQEEELRRKQKEEEDRKQKELKELLEKQKREKEKEKEKNEINEESEESDGEDYSSEKNFLSDREDSKEKAKGPQKFVSNEEYDKLNKKYLELERRISVLEKEKEEMSTLLRTLFLQNKSNIQIPMSENKEGNINDLMALANKELENKNKIIHDLEGKVSKFNLNNVNEFSSEQLKEYKDFYTKKLKTINDALKKY